MTHTAKHTPGPWVINVNGDITSPHGAVCWLPAGIAERSANAFMLAAAPAMYEALQQSLVLVELAALEEWGRAVRGEQQPPTTEARDRLEKVKAALAQAEGTHV